MIKKIAYKIVFKDLCKVGLFMGKYDAKNGSSTFMCGINTVMEFIASSISEKHYNKFNNLFLSNMKESKRKVKE